MHQLLILCLKIHCADLREKRCRTAGNAGLHLFYENSKSSFLFNSVIWKKAVFCLQMWFGKANVIKKGFKIF